MAHPVKRRSYKDPVGAPVPYLQRIHFSSGEAALKVSVSLTLPVSPFPLNLSLLYPIKKKKKMEKGEKDWENDDCLEQ